VPTPRNVAIDALSLGDIPARCLRQDYSCPKKAPLEGYFPDRFASTRG